MKKSTEELLWLAAGAAGILMILKSQSSAKPPAAGPLAKLPAPPAIDPGAGFSAGGGVAPGWGLGPMPDPNDPAWSGSSPTPIDGGTMTIGGQSSMSGYFYRARRRR